MLNVLLDHLFGNVSSTHHEVASGPQVLSPVPFLEGWVFHLELSRRFPFEVLYQGAGSGRRVYGDENMDMIWGDGAWNDFDILLYADSPDEVSRSLAYLSLQHTVAILGNPRDVELDAEDWVGRFAIFIGHDVIVYRTGSYRLKAREITRPKWGLIKYSLFH